MAAYVSTRAARFAEKYDNRYKALRAEHPTQMLAHNGSGFDNCALLEHLVFTGRISVERSALKGGAVGEHVTLSVDPFAPLDTGQDTWSWAPPRRVW